MLHIVKAYIYVCPEFELCGVGHAHFQCNFPFANSGQMTNILFQTPPKQLDRFAPQLAWTICGPSWQKVIKRILIVHNTQNTKQQFLALENRQSCISLQNTVQLSHKCSCLCGMVCVKFGANRPIGGTLVAVQIIVKGKSCHVIVHNRLSLSMGLRGVAAGASPRAGYSLDKTPAHRRALTDEQCGVQYLAQGHVDIQLSRDLNQRPSNH